MRKPDKLDLFLIIFGSYIIIGIIVIIIFLLISCQPKKSYEYLGCPCKIIDKKETPRGYQVTMINSNNVTVRILDKDLKEREIGEIIE